MGRLWHESVVKDYVSKKRYQAMKPERERVRERERERERESCG